MPNKIISLFDWLTYYLPEIRKTLELPNNDTEVVLQNKDLQNFSKGAKPNITTNKVVVFSTANVVEYQVQKIIENDLIKRYSDQFFSIAIDGIVPFLHQHKIPINAIFTDLDGEIELTANLANQGTPTFVLLHGDNQDKIELFKKKIKSSANIIWCTQGLPIFGYENTLGFTDGDRACLYAANLNNQVLIIGFDLYSNEIGKRSLKHKDMSDEYISKKIKKLEIASNLLKLIENRQLLYTLDERLSPGIKISFEEFMELK
jgi:uncharacterized Rossmann fold enzyme